MRLGPWFFDPAPGAIESGSTPLGPLLKHDYEFCGEKESLDYGILL
jgi:hypothetical protein